MTEAKKILELIESVDPADSAALDEIDVLSHIFAKNWECDGVVNIKANDRGSGGIDYYLKDNNHAFGGQNLHLKLKYTRSRDALKSIRPEGFWCEFKKADDGDWVGILGKDGDMAKAGACYALGNPIIANKAGHKIRIWPWSKIGWNPKDKRRNLVRAAALIIAEIEKLDRKECTIMKTYHDQDSWEERDDAPSPMIIVWVVCSLIAGLAALLYFAA